MSVTEVLRAMEVGADVVKIFPAELFGPKIIEAIKGPLPQAPLLPTGGAKKGDYDEVKRTAIEFIKKIRSTRNQTS